MSFYDRANDNKVRTYVLVADVPRCLTEHEVRHTLREQTVGIMKVLALTSEATALPDKNDGYVLALYESRAAAVEACDAGVSVSVPVDLNKLDGERRDVPLRMVPVQHQQVNKLEATYRETIDVNGEEVKKSDLAPTKGLQLVLSSSVGIGGPEERRGVSARWCRHTELQQDCPRGTSCKYLHLSKYQRTSRHGGDAAAAAKRDRADEGESATAPEHVADAGAVVGPVASAVPLQYRPPMARVAVNRLELLSIGLRHEDAPDDADLDEVRAALSKRVEAAMAEVKASTNIPEDAKGRFIVRIDGANGTPFDAPLTSTSNALMVEDVRKRLPKPHVFNTPLDRDAYLQKVLGAALEKVRCSSASEALDLLEGSKRVADAVDAALARSRAAGIAGTDVTTALAHLAVLPAYASEPVPMSVATVFFDGGDVFATVQRHSDLLAAVVRPKAAAIDDGSALMATQSTAMLEKVEGRASKWLHRFAVTTKLHLAMAGRKEDRLAVTVALPHMSRCVAAWRADPDSGDLNDADLGTPPVVAISVRSFDAAARENSLVPPAKLPEGEVRWRKTKSVFTQHLPRELQEFLNAAQ